MKKSPGNRTVIRRPASPTRRLDPAKSGRGAGDAALRAGDLQSLAWALFRRYRL